jgi:hypothetical protein
VEELDRQTYENTIYARKDALNPLQKALENEERNCIIWSKIWYKRPQREVDTKDDIIRDIRICSHDIRK